MSSITSISTNQSSYYKNSLANLDKDGNGKISSQEFTLAKPADVSDTQSASLFDRLSNGNSDGIIFDQTTSSDSDADSDSDYSVMSDMMSRMMSLMQTMMSETASDPSAAQSSGDDNPLLKADTDNDGKITLSEFISGKPEDLTEEQATELFAKMDTESQGYITTDSVKNGPPEQPSGPPPSGPPPSEQASGSTETEDDTSDTLLLETLKSIQEAIEQYRLNIADTTTTQETAFTL
jgi:Ca2+-binding EF-hand superfamily protein